MLLSFENKIQEVSYDSLPERDFNLRYVDGARVFLSDTGMRAFPFASDPLVMYYNKSILNTAGIVTPPTLWSQFIGLVPELTTLDSNQNILKSGLAFGQFNNIPYATNLMEAFLLQLGTPIITKDISGQYISVIDTSSVRETKPLSTSLQFFTLFADPLKETYSWNSVMPSAEDMFVQDRLALYFAPASKFLDIQRKNINLNYDITKLPQVSVTSNFVTSADFYGVAISKNSKVLSGAFAAANLLSNGEYNKTILEANFLAPVRRDLLSGAREQDPYKAAVRESALIAQTWQNPDSRGFSSIISNGVDDIIKGILSPGMASLRIQGEMTVLINSLKR
jgi:ABC-type glycerol-3-phosphate transport system substrate-binding protein